MSGFPILFVYRAFDADANPLGNDDVEFYASDKSAARDRVGRMAKRNGGPVDLAYAAVGPLEDASWDDRYVSTALPSEYTKRGYMFERIMP